MNDFSDKARELGVPLISPKGESPRNPDPNPTIAVCGKCGIELKRMMHFACGHSDCPTGLGQRGTLMAGDLKLDYTPRETIQETVSKAVEMFDAMDVMPGRPMETLMPSGGYTCHPIKAVKKVEQVQVPIRGYWNRNTFYDDPNGREFNGYRLVDRDKLTLDDRRDIDEHATGLPSQEVRDDVAAFGEALRDKLREI